MYSPITLTLFMEIPLVLLLPEKIYTRLNSGINTINDPLKAALDVF